MLVTTSRGRGGTNTALAAILSLSLSPNSFFLFSLVCCYSSPLSLFLGSFLRIFVVWEEEKERRALLVILLQCDMGHWLSVLATWRILGFLLAASLSSKSTLQAFRIFIFLKGWGVVNFLSFFLVKEKSLP